jgi:hypothetical protein
MRLHEIKSNITDIYKPVTADSIDAIRAAIKKYDVNLAITNYKSGTRIYRGMDTDKKIMYGSSNNHIRHSANTSNEVNLFVSNDETWNNFPKRNQSFICICGKDSQYEIEYYGETYVVLPISNPNIGLCPSLDFWDGFRTGISSINISTYDGVPDINYFIKQIAIFCGFETQIKSYNDIIEIANILDDIVRTKPKKLSKVIRDGTLKEIAIFADGKYSLIDALRSMLSPKVNGFKVQNFAEFSNYADNEPRECWFSGEAIFIDLEIADEVIEGILQ